MTENMTSRINWPAGFEPENSPIHAANEIEINAAPDLVWKRIIEAPRWPEYYPHASEIHLPAGEDVLRSDMQFTWVTAGKKIVTTVKEYVPNERIAWEVVLPDDASSTAYHAWLITPTDHGSHVLTEETQQGPFWEELAKKMPDGLHHFHQDWVEKLAEVAETDAASSIKNQNTNEVRALLKGQHMIKMSLFLTRRSDLTREQFNDYWLNKHWPIVQSVPEVKKYTRRYVQLHNLGQTPQGYAALPFDGVAEAWFDSLEDFRKAVTSKAWHDIVQKDDLNYLDPSKTQVLVSEEKVNFKA